MNKNKLFILFSIITLIFIFGLAATCNLCGTPVTIGGEDTTQESKETTEETIRQNQQSQQTTQQTQGEPAAPTIELKISEGPLYSEADDVCYWRVEAIVTGNPVPDITWNRDDSEGLGDNIAQVNLTRDNPEYTLVGTAKNSIDTATDEITVRWECDGEVVAEGDNDNIPDQDQNGGVKEIVITNPSEREATSERAFPGVLGNIEIGDNADNEEIRGWYIFDIEQLNTINNINILEVKLTISNIELFGPDPGYGKNIVIENVENTGFHDSGFTINVIPLTGLTKMSFSNESVRNSLIDTITRGDSKYILRFKFGIPSNDNDQSDGSRFFNNSASLTVNYSN
jgi:hypothetical protein